MVKLESLGGNHVGQAIGYTLLQVLFWIIAVMLSVLLFYGIFSSPTGIKGYLNKKNQFSIINKNIQSLEKENERLYRAIKQFRAHPESRKEMIRRHLGWIHDGERKIIFVPQQ